VSLWSLVSSLPADRLQTCHGPFNMHGLVEARVHRGRHHLLPTRALLIGTSLLPFIQLSSDVFFGKGPKYFPTPITSQHISAKFSVSSRGNNLWTKTQAPRLCSTVTAHDSSPSIYITAVGPSSREAAIAHLAILAHLHHPLRLACLAHIKYYIPFIPEKNSEFCN
jgi:hypothetical protein